MARKKAERKPKNLGEAIGLTNIYRNEKPDFILGAIMLAVALYVILAMISYISTGAADQSLLENMSAREVFQNGKLFTNYCGSLGAVISYYLIAVNFGYPAFLIPLFFVLVALRVMEVYRVNLWKWFFCLAVVMIWTSVALAKFLTPFTGGLVYNPGGAHGLYVVQQLEALVGAPGLIALLIITAVSFLTYLTSETITVIRKLLNPSTIIKKKINFTVNISQNGESADDSEESTAGEKNEGAVAAEEPDTAEADTPSSPIDLTDFTSVNNDESANKGGKQTNNGETANGKAGGKSTAELTVEPVHKDEALIAHGGTATVEEVLSTPINPREPWTKYQFPTLSLLKKYDLETPQVNMVELKANNDRIVEVLNSFGVGISAIKANVGPTITLYEITPAEGVRISKIRNLEDDIALSLSALGIRIIAPIPGKGTIGIEVPNKNPMIVSMESILNTKKFKDSKMDLPIALGKTITNEVFMVDLAKIPHLLVAGATGQGKSVGLNAIITSLLYKKHPNELKFVLVDPKKVEFSIYNKIAPHFMAALPENEEEPIITDVSKVVRTLNSLCQLMDHRYDLLKQARAKNIKEYNDKYVHHKLDLTKGHEYMPYIVVIIDEFGDLIMTAGKEIELPIARIAQLARAVGIHMVIATQRPTTKIITGNIKANFPGRIAFRVSSQIDSRTILDRTGANQLVGRGDMLFLNGNEPIRVQCAFVDTPEIERVNEFIADQPGPLEPMELPEPAEESGSIGGGGESADIKNLDPYFEEAAHAIVISQQGSTSMIQRRFSIGYNRAGRLMDQLCAAGIVGEAQGSKPREVLIQDENSLNNLLAKLRS